MLKGGMDAWKDEGYKTVVTKVTKASRGEDLYEANCITCHQAAGRGLKQQFPPLAGNAVVNLEDPRPAIKAVLHGMSGTPIGGVQYNAIMPGFRETMTDEEVAEVLTFIRSNWGNKAPAVTPSMVKSM